MAVSFQCIQTNLTPAFDQQRSNDRGDRANKTPNFDLENIDPRLR